MSIIRRVPALLICLAFLFSSEAQASCRQLFAVIERIDIVLDFDRFLVFPAEAEGKVPGEKEIVVSGKFFLDSKEARYRLPDGLEEFLESLTNLPEVRLSVYTMIGAFTQAQVKYGYRDNFQFITMRRLELLEILGRIRLSGNRSLLDLLSDGEGGHRIHIIQGAEKDLTRIHELDLERTFLIDDNPRALSGGDGTKQEGNLIRAFATERTFGLPYPESMGPYDSGYKEYRVDFLRARNDLARIRGLIAEILEISRSGRISPVEAWSRLRGQIEQDEWTESRVHGDDGTYWYLRGAELFREVNPDFRLTRLISEEE